MITQFEKEFEILSLARADLRLCISERLQNYIEVVYLEKILNFSNPVITSYPRNANVISILQDHPHFESWLYMNHNQLHLNVEDNYYWLMFYQPLGQRYFPLINCQTISKSTIKNVNIIDLIIQNIDSGNYAFLIVDRYYIRAYSDFFHKKHVSHDIFIYGYNKEEETFNIADFFNNGVYQQKKCSFFELSSAFYSELIDEHKETQGLQFLEVDYSSTFKFDMNYMIKILSSYLNSENPSWEYQLLTEPLGENYIFGMKIYQELIDAIRKYEINKSLIQTLHVLYDHKVLMYKRAEFLLNRVGKENHILLEQFKLNKDSALICRNLYLKYSMTKKFELKDSICKKLDSMREIESRNIEELIEILLLSEFEGSVDRRER